jgi:molecular chaperone GrpE
MVSRKKKAEQERVAGQKAAADAAEREPVGLADEGSDEAGLEEPGRANVEPSSEEVIEALSTELEELEDRHLRVVAEFDNFRKRTVRERAQQETRAQAELARQLLESLDDLSRVSELGSHDHDAAAILEGVQLVETKLRRALEQLGLSPIEAVGKPFNPELHEAMVTVPTERPDEDEIVAQELAKGYMFRGSLLRPSRVQVKMYRPGSGDDETGEAESES